MRKRILAIDPGTTQSAWLVYSDGKLGDRGIEPNACVLARLHDDSFDADHLAIEMIESFGMSVGQEIFQTVLWIGRFIEAWTARRSNEAAHTRVYRKDVKLHLCGTPRAKDPNIRQALMDKFGGSYAVGKRRTPGPLYGISKDLWSALAVAVTYDETGGRVIEA